MTLIEVVLGLVILGTLLASLAVARGRFQRQAAAADRKLAAVQVLDALIADWMRESSVPIGKEGTVVGRPQFVWRTREVRGGRTAGEVSALQARICRVEVFDRIVEPSSVPVASVELLVHAPPNPAVREGQ